MNAQSPKLNIQKKFQAPMLESRPRPALAETARCLLRIAMWSFTGALSFGPGTCAFAAVPDDPAAEWASFQVAEGFEVSLFASEKDGVVKPIQMRFDARGRLWVISSTVYPQIEPGQRPNDKVLVLEDPAAHGRCTKTTVFADALMIPSEIELS